LSAIHVAMLVFPLTLPLVPPVCYGGGLRRAEVVALDVEDFDAPTGALVIRGKGSRERSGYASNGTLAALERWLEVRGSEPGPLFLAVNKGGNVVHGRRLTTQGVYLVVTEHARQAGVQAAPHDLRRSFVSDLLDAGADLAVVQKLAGHASPATTSRYDRRGEVAKRRAVELLAVPLALPAR
jgi:integrase/recombinase XerD